MAQGMVSEIKIVAVQKTDSLAPQAEGYSGAGNFDLDFRKGRGGGYVFAIFKSSTDPNQYITDVKVEKRDLFGVEFDAGDKKYVPVPYFQVTRATEVDLTAVTIASTAEPILNRTMSISRVPATRISASACSSR